MKRFNQAALLVGAVGALGGGCESRSQTDSVAEAREAQAKMLEPIAITAGKGVVNLYYHHAGGVTVDHGVAIFNGALFKLTGDVGNRGFELDVTVPVENGKPQGPAAYDIRLLEAPDPSDRYAKVLQVATTNNAPEDAAQNWFADERPYDDNPQSDDSNLLPTSPEDAETYVLTGDSPETIAKKMARTRQLAKKAKYITSELIQLARQSATG